MDEQCWMYMDNNVITMRTDTCHRATEAGGSNR